MWSPDDGPYTGKHYQLTETLCSPPPLSTPRPRILIGGAGERKTLRLVARYADACNIVGDAATLAHKVDVLRRHCDALGRDPAEIEVTALVMSGGVTGTDELLAQAEALGAAGADTVVVGPPPPEPARWLEEVCGPLVARLAELGPG